MNNKRIAIIGANSFQNKLIERAKERGYETHVFAWEAGDVGERTADYFYPVSIIEKEEILNICKKINPQGICSIASDLAVPTVNYVANSLGLCANSNKSSLIATNKYRMRQTFIDNKLPSPKFCLFNETMHYSDFKPSGLEYPLIIKPTDRSGSRGVTQIDSFEELKPALGIAMDESFCKSAIVEEYVQGEEYSVEYITYEGKHYFLAMTKKFTTGYPHFVEIAHFQPAIMNEDKSSEVKKVVERALDALDITYGASHSEIKVTPDGKIKIIEIGARMGGGCIGSDLVKISTGYDFVDLVIDIACGEKPKFNKVRESQIAFIRFIMSENDMLRMNDIHEKHPELFYEVSGHRPEKDVLKPISSEDRTGYYILALDNKEQLMEICDYTIEEKYR